MNLKEWLFGKKGYAGAGVGTPIGGNGKWIPIGNSVVYAPQDTLSYIQDGYQTNDIVYSIVNGICDKAVVAPWEVYKIKSESSLKKYKACLNEITTTKGSISMLTKQALKYKDESMEIATDSRLSALLQYPNLRQSWSELLREELIYKLVTGNKYLAAEMLDSGANTGKPGQLYCLPAQYMSILADGNFPAQASLFRMQLGQLITYDPTQILHEKYPSIDYTLGFNNLYGQSPLLAAAMLISRTNESTKSGAVAMKNRGAGGLAYIDDPNVDPNFSLIQASQMKAEFNRNFRNDDNKGGIMFSNTKMGFLQTNLSPADLKIIESEKWDLVRLCSVYSFPPVLLTADNATYNNYEHAEKALITGAVLPQLTAKRDALNRKLQTDWGYKGQNLMVDFDMSVYSVLQEDNEKTAKYLNTAWWISPEQKMEIQGLEVPDYLKGKPEMQRIYPPRGTEVLAADGTVDGPTAPNMTALDKALKDAGLNDYE